MRRRRTQSRLSSKASGHKKGSNNAGARIAFPVGLLRRLSQAFASPVRKGCSPSSGSDSAHFLETSRVQEGASQPRPCLLHLRPLNFASRQHRRGVTESAGVFFCGCFWSNLRPSHWFVFRNTQSDPIRISASHDASEGRTARRIKVSAANCLAAPARRSEDAGSVPHG